jgi:tRNA-Thr(GGU) m(6)t(6)A37 methyltransferase TsaA
MLARNGKYPINVGEFPERMPRFVAALAAPRLPCKLVRMVNATSRNRTEDGPASRPGPSGLREGEVAAALPEDFGASLYFIGRIHTPWQRRDDCPKNARESDAICTIVVDPRWIEALKGLESVSHVIVLYWMDEARRDLVLQAPHHYSERRGTFALRSPVRPNPIALSVARLVGIDGNKLSVIGLDCRDNTPLLDIKPYFASTDSVPEASVGWHASGKQ